MKPMVDGEKPSCAPRSAISVPCRPLPPSRMPAAIRRGISGRMEDMECEAIRWRDALIGPSTPADCQQQYRRALVGPRRPYLDKSGPPCAFPREFSGRRRRCRPVTNAPDQDMTMHRYRSHTCAQLRKSDVGADRAPVRLGASRARPWRPAVHRPARPLRHDADRRRSGFAGLQDGRDGARRMGDPRRRRGQGAHGRDRQRRTCRPARSRFSRARSRCCRRPRNCRCRCSASRTIRKTSA